MVYQDVLAWLQSSNTELQLSGALAIANFARNGEQMNVQYNSFLLQLLIQFGFSLKLYFIKNVFIP